MKPPAHVSPRSELAIEEHWYPTTKVERYLTARSDELFSAELDVLYGLTSSYVEGGASKNPMMGRR